MLKSHVIKGKTDGPAFLLTGAVHGDEKCGTAAIGRLLMEIEAGLVTLETGTLTAVPICNPKAYDANKRQTEANLNRVIRHHENPAVYEHHLANELVKLIDATDIMLDLHSYTCGTLPFLFLDNDTPEIRAYAQAVGIPSWLKGWDDLYADKQDLNGGDTTSYCKSKGKTSLLIECGQHDDPASIIQGYHATRAALAHFGLTAPYAPVNTAAPQTYHMTAIVTKDRDGRFSKDWQHLDPVKKGDEVIHYTDGTTLTAPEDGVVIMPNPKALPGAEWIYFGVVG